MSTSQHHSIHSRSLPAPLAPTRADPPARRPPPPPLLLRFPRTQDQASLFAFRPSTPLTDPGKSLIYFEASSEKAGILRKLLLNQTQDYSSFITTTISEASHVLVEPPSFLGDLLLRAHAQSSSSSSSSTSSSLLRPQYILNLRWLEDCIKLQTWQPEQGYFYVPNVARDRQSISQSSVEGSEVVAVVDPNKQVVPSFRFSSSTATNASIPQPRPPDPFAARNSQTLPTSSSPTDTLEPPSFLRFGVAPSSSSSRPASYCWFCASEANEINTLTRIELVEPVVAGSGELMRFARYCCEKCLQEAWVESNVLVGGTLAAEAGKVRSLEEFVWFTRKLKDRGLEKRRARVRVKDGGTAETSSFSSSVDRFSSAQVVSSSPVSNTTVVGQAPPVVPSKRTSASASISSEPSSSKKSRVESSIDAPGPLPTSSPSRQPSPSSSPIATAPSPPPKSTSTAASGPTLEEAVELQAIISPPPPPVASLPNQPNPLPSASCPSIKPSHPSPSAPTHPTSPSHPSCSTQITSEPPSFLDLGVPPSTNLCTPTLPFCYFCGTGTLESSSFKLLDLADELPPNSGTFVKAEARLACEFCVERYESRLPTKEGDGDGLKRLTVVTAMLKENGVRERRMLVASSEEGGTVGA